MITNYKLIGSAVFTRFKKIPDKAFNDFYFFYQYYFNQIVKLEYEEYIEIKFNYIEALFKLDKYNLFYLQADEFLSELINHQTFSKRQQEIYEWVLYLKALALKNENKHEKACKIYSELVKWKPENKTYRRKLILNLFQNVQLNQKYKMSLVLLFLLSTLVLTAFYEFIFNNSNPEIKNTMLYLRNITFSLGILLFIGLQFMYFIKAKKLMTFMLTTDKINGKF